MVNLVSGNWLGVEIFQITHLPIYPITKFHLFPVAAARRFLGVSGFLNPKAISASSNSREPVGVAMRSFQARSPLSPFRLDLGAIQRSPSPTISDAGCLRAFFFEAKVHFQRFC